MRTNRGRQAATVVRAPNLITVDIAQQRWRSYIFRWRELVHQMIAADLPAPASDDLHAGATVEAVAPVKTGRSFWDYAEDTKPIPALT